MRDDEARVSDFCKPECFNQWKAWIERSGLNGYNPQYVRTYRGRKICLFCWDPVRKD